MNYYAVNSHINVNHRRVLYGKLAVVSNLHLDTFMHRKMSRFVLLALEMFLLIQDSLKENWQKGFM